MDKCLNRLGEERYNHQGCLMKIIQYKNANEIIIEFQDKYRAKICTRYDRFIEGCIRNPYHPIVCGVGAIGIKYTSRTNGRQTKEHLTWINMLHRCFDEEYKKKMPTYKDTICCTEWLLYENFYEWLHNQSNFDKWLTGDRWAIDKDILVKGNKIYSPETCCLVPHNVNMLFVKNDIDRSNLPIGVKRNGSGFQVFCNNPYTNKQESLGTYLTPEQAFQVYKTYKENIIKQVAQTEYDNGNITEQCYKAMMKYEVEITD